MKKETLEEFKKRGGIIKKIPAGTSGLAKEKPETKEVTAHPRPHGPATLYSWEEGDELFGDPSKAKKPTVLPDISINDIDPEILPVILEILDNTDIGDAERHPDAYWPKKS